MSSAIKIAKNTTFLFTSTILTNFISFIIIVILTRFLGDVGLGKYSFAFSFIMIVFTIGANFGIEPLITREIAKKREEAKDYMSNAITLIGLLGIISVVVGVSIIFFSKNDMGIAIIVLLAGIAYLLDQINVLFKGVLTAFERIPTYSLIIIIERIVALTFSFFILYLGYGIKWFMISFIISNSVILLIAYLIISSKIAKPSLSFNMGKWKALLIRGAPFWFTGMFIVIYFRIDNVMLAFMKDYAVAGWYEAAYKIQRMLTIFPSAIITVIFPVMSRFHVKSKKLLLKLYGKSFYYLSIIALPIAAGTTFIARDIIRLVYKQDIFLLHSSLALQIIIWALVFLYFNLLMGYLLNSIGKEKLFTYSTGLCVILNISLNIFLIPRYSYVGAGIATVVTEIFNFAVLSYFTKKNKYSLKYIKIITKPVIATVIMAFAMFYLYNKLNIFLFVIICAIVYFATLLLFKGIGKDEINLIKQMVPIKR